MTDFERLLNALTRSGVEFIVIGGFAAAAHGSAHIMSISMSSIAALLTTSAVSFRHWNQSLWALVRLIAMDAILQVARASVRFIGPMDLDFAIRRCHRRLSWSAMADWDIRAEGRAWRSEAMDRYALTPEKLEMIGGKLLYDDEQRLTLLALLLENVGADAAVRLGNADVWRAAVAKLE